MKTKIRETDMPDSEEIILLKRRLESHIDIYRDDHHENDIRHRKSEAMHEKNMEAMEKLTTSTQGVVDAWVFANGFHRFVKWLSGFAVLGGVIVWIQQTFK